MSERTTHEQFTRSDHACDAIADAVRADHDRIYQLVAALFEAQAALRRVSQEAETHSRLAREVLGDE